jgi:hypothetical protein
MHQDECCPIDDLKPNPAPPLLEDEPMWTLSARRILLLGAASWLILLGIGFLFI